MSLLHVTQNPKITIAGKEYWYYQLDITLLGKGFRDWPGNAFAANDEEGWMEFFQTKDRVIETYMGKPIVFRVYGKVVFTPNAEPEREPICESSSPAL